MSKLGVSKLSNSYEDVQTLLHSSLGLDMISGTIGRTTNSVYYQINTIELKWVLNAGEYT